MQCWADCQQYGKQSKFSLATKLKVYNSLMLSVLLHRCETWTILIADKRKLEAFHMQCQRRICIPRIHWFHRVTNANVISQTSQEDLASLNSRRRMVVFGYVRQLPKEAPGQLALWLAVDT